MIFVFGALVPGVGAKTGPQPVATPVVVKPIPTVSDMRTASPFVLFWHATPLVKTATGWSAAIMTSEVGNENDEIVMVKPGLQGTQRAVTRARPRQRPKDVEDHAVPFTNN